METSELIDAVRVMLKEQGETLMPTIAQPWANEAREVGFQQLQQEFSAQRRRDK